DRASKRLQPTTPFGFPFTLDCGNDLGWLQVYRAVTSVPGDVRTAVGRHLAALGYWSFVGTDAQPHGGMDVAHQIGVGFRAEATEGYLECAGLTALSWVAA